MVAVAVVAIEVSTETRCFRLIQTCFNTHRRAFVFFRVRGKPERTNYLQALTVRHPCVRGCSITRATLYGFQSLTNADEIQEMRAFVHSCYRLVLWIDEIL